MQPPSLTYLPLTEGISSQAIERHADEFERALAEGRKALQLQLAAEAKAAFETKSRALAESLAAKEASLAKARDEELALRRQLRESQEASRNQELAYARKLDDERRKIEDKARAAAAEEFSRKEAQFRLGIRSGI